MRIWKWDSENNFRPRGASDLGQNMAIPLWITQNGKGKHVIEGSVIKNVNPEDMTNLLYANGVPVEDLEDVKKGDWTIGNAFMGYTLDDGTGKQYMVVDALDENNKLDKDRNESLYDTEGSEAAYGRNAMFITLKAPNGDEYVQRINFSGTVHESALADALGTANDLSDQYTERKGNQDSLDRLTENVKVAIEMNFNGKAALNEFQRHEEYFDGIVLRTFHTSPIPGEKQPPKKPGFKQRRDKDIGEGSL